MKKITSKASGALLGILLCASSVSFGGINPEFGKTKNSNSVAVCPTITVKAVTSNNGCYGLNNGIEVVSATGGAIPYTFSWSTGATSTSNTNDTLKNLSPGSYTVNVTDMNGCPGSLNFTLTQPTQLRDSISAYVMVKCNGGKTGNATVGVKGGTTAYTYKWTPGGGTSATLSGSTFFNNQAAGSYEVVVTDKNGCKDSATAVITQPAAIKDSISVTNVLCNGGKTGGATVVSTIGGTSPYTYTWATVPPTTGTTVSGLGSGSYTLTTRDGNNCTATNTVTITQPAVLTVSATSTVQASCGQSNGAAYATVAGGTIPYSFTWTPSGGTNDTAKGIAAGSYTVTVKDANGCSANASTSVTDNSTLAAIITATVNVTPCNGGSNGSATGSGTGGTPNYTYSWSNGATTSTISNLTAGTYTLTVTDSKNCFASTTVTITQPSQVKDSATTTANVTCYGDSNGSVTMGAKGGTGPYTYVWSNGATASSLTNLKVGTYTVTASDANGCKGSVNISITQPTLIKDTITSQTNEACYGNTNGRVTIGVTGGNGGYTYSWAPGGSTRNRVTGGAGTYTVTITDSKGCTKKDSVTITQPSALRDSIRDSISVACFGTKTGSASVGVIGGTPGYTYTWTGGGGTKDTASNLGAGTYTVTVRDKNNCTITAVAVITQPASAISAKDSVYNASCSKSNGSVMVKATGGTPGYTYAWTPSGGTADSAYGLAQGIYNCTITDSKGCTYTVTANIHDSTTLAEALTTRTNVTPCFGDHNGTANFHVSGGTGPYTYSWSPSGGTDTTASNLAAGTYTFTASDSKGCQVSDTVIITRPTLVVATISASTNVKCNGLATGSATVTASGGAGSYTYSWAPGGITTAAATGLVAGNYTITVTDKNSCTAIDSVNITQPAALRDSIRDSINATCYGTKTGSASVGVNGGTPGYTYTWTAGGGTKDTASNLGAGTYTVTIRDKNNCTITASVTIGQPAQLRDSLLTSTNVHCFGGNDGSASVGVKGGTMPYIYTWSPSGATTSSVNNLNAGSYTVTVSDANGCSANSTSTVSISQPAKALADSAKDTAAACNKSNGYVIVYPYGGTSSYTYNWNNGSTTNYISGVAAGSYTCTITDANGCHVNSTILVADSSTLAGNISLVSNVSCNGMCNGSANVIASGGTGTYAYSWTGGSTTTSANGLCAGLSSVKITDTKGCTVTDTLTISQPSIVAATAKAAPAIVCAGQSSTITITATGGTGAYSYLWSPGGATASPIIVSPAVTTTYTYSVKDVNNCSTTNTITVSVYPSLQATAGASSAICPGSKATVSVNASGGDGTYTYAWSPALGTNAGPYIVNPSATTVYSCSVTDGCSSVVAVSEEVIVDHVISVTSIDSSITGNCTNTIWAVVSGGTKPYLYAWNTTPVQTNDTATSLCQGNYAVTVTDSIGCKTTDSLKVINPNGINEIQANSSIKLYPVPTNGNLYVSISNKEFIPQSVMVYDITGRELINEKASMNTNIVTIDVSKLENGTYILKLVNGNNEKLARFVVAK
jgi:hypothetical protein